MISQTHKQIHKKGFTIVELLVVIAVISVLATIVGISFGAWKKNSIEAQVKSDLNGVASAMENARNFGSGYPQSPLATTLTTFKPSSGVTLAGGGAIDGKSYCIDGTSSQDASVQFYIASETKDKGPQSGVCATRSTLPAPGVPSGLAVVSAAGTTVVLSWSAAVNAATYTAQCASDPGFIVGLQSSTVNSPTVTATVSGLSSSSNYYCRVNATNANSTSAWSSYVTTTTISLLPASPSGLAVVSASGTTIALSWSTVTNADNYTAQCASDTGFTVGLQSSTVTSPNLTATVSGLLQSTNYYCRVNAVNSYGSSAWATYVTATTTNARGSLAVATSIEGYWATPPQGFLLEDGSAVSRATYSDLYAVIGNSYGAGNGSTTFNLPDSRGRVPVNLSAADAEFSSMGQKYGTKTETLTIAQIPSHTHIQDPHTHTALGRTEAIGQASGWGGVTSAVRAQTYSYNLVNQFVRLDASTATNQYTGGNGAHNNIQSSIVMMAAIKYAKVDPTSASLPAGTSIQGYWGVAPSSEYLSEDGSAVSRTTYASLFAAIGTSYGAGNGSTTFNLPDSRGRVAVNKSSDVEFNTMGEKYGEKTHILTITEIASHTHIQDPHTHNAVGRTDATGQAAGWAGSNSGVRASANSYTQDSETISLTTDTATNQYIGGDQAHNNIQPSMVKLSVIKVTPATSTGTDLAPGTSVQGYWSSATAPAGYLPEDGSAVSRTTYASLFAAIGTSYGAGNGSTTFNIPDSRGRVAVNLGPSDAEFNTMGEIYGEKTHTLTIAEMASHTHVQNSHLHTALGKTDAIGQAAGWGGLDSIVRAQASSYTQDNQLVFVGNTAATNQYSGGGQPHNNIQPSIVKLFVVKY